MTGKSRKTGEESLTAYSQEDLQVLTFNVGGVSMAVDTAQIDKILETDEAAEKKLKTERLDKIIPFYNSPVIFGSPRVLVTKDEVPFGIVIDRPGDIVSVPLDSIRPLPALLSDSKCPKAIWGAALRNDEVILLVDFYKLKNKEDMVRNTA